MKLIVDYKIYDTEKSELLCTFDKRWKIKTLCSVIYPLRETKLYRTAKGAYFLTCKKNCNDMDIEVIEEDAAKEYLMYNNYDKYTEMFGELEEA